MDTIALILSIIGSLNWGLVGIFKFDLVAWIFGGQTAVVSRIVYTLVGLAGLWCISLLFRKRAPTLRPSVPSTEGPLCTRCSAQAQGSPERGAGSA